MASSGPVGDHIAGHSLHGLQVLLQGALQPGVQQRLHTKCPIISRDQCHVVQQGGPIFCIESQQIPRPNFFPRLSGGLIDLAQVSSIYIVTVL